jgi:hypothetical protein
MVDAQRRCTDVIGPIVHRRQQALYTGFSIGSDGPANSFPLEARENKAEERRRYPATVRITEQACSISPRDNLAEGNLGRSMKKDIGLKANVVFNVHIVDIGNSKAI